MRQVPVLAVLLSRSRTKPKARPEAWGPRQLIQFSGPCHLAWVIQVGPGTAEAGMGCQPPKSLRQ